LNSQGALGHDSRATEKEKGAEGTGDAYSFITHQADTKMMLAWHLSKAMARIKRKELFMAAPSRRFLCNHLY
jgi:hypothetical protein